MKPEFNSEDESAWSPSDANANDNPDIEVTEAELAALKDEVEVLHGGDIKEAADKLLDEKVLKAIMSIAKLATEAAAERVRLDASKYIVERVLGPLSKIEFDKNPEKDPMYRFMRKVGMLD